MRVSLRRRGARRSQLISRTVRSSSIESLEDRLFLAAQAYDWNSVTIKANGYIDGIVYNPAAANTVYIHTDMGGAYRWDQSLSKWMPLNDWLQNNDFASNNGAESLAVDPTDANRVYMVSGTYQSSAAMLRSSDGGRTWQRTDVSGIKVDGNGWGRNVGERMAVDPNLPSIVYYGARYYSASNSGLWKSTDYAASWNKLANFTTLGDIWNNSYTNANGVGLPFVVFDKASGTAGTATPRIYVGVASTASTNTKLYRTGNGGTNWEPIPNQPTTALTPNRAVLSPDGTVMYVAYANQAGPYGASSGALYKVTNPSSANPIWTAVTPSAGAYSAIAFDPTNPNTVYAGVFDRYPDNIYRSTNGGTSWTALNPNSYRDDSSAPYASSMSIHWLTDLEIDPFNNNVAIFNTGYGLYRTTNLTASTPTWSFFNDGFEQVADLELNSPNTGAVHLLSAIGDRDGYRHDDFSQSPAIGLFGQRNQIAAGTCDDVDSAFNNANYVVRLTRVSPYVQYSTNNGIDWAWMPSTGVSGSTSGGGNVAISADGTKVVYEPGGTGRVIYSTRSGSTWSDWSTPTTNRPANGAKIVADSVGSQTVYAYVGTTVSRSTDGGATWTSMTTSAPSGAGWIRALPGQSGHLVVSRGSNGVWRSTNGGATWTRLASSAVTTANWVGVGAGPTPSSYPSIFVGGTVSGLTGFFRSDDQGDTWVMISDLAHQYGYVTVIQGDPRVYGRLYVGTNGRGILYADIHTPQTALPAGWSTQNVGAPGSTGSAGSADGSTWEVIGGGTGIAGTADTFRYAYTSLTGDAEITARVVAVPNASPANNNAKAGVMIRDGVATGAANVFLAMTPGAVNGAVFQYRSTGGGSTTINANPGIWNPYWVRLTRTGNLFSAQISPDGTLGTPIGTITLPMSASVTIGLAVTASDNNQLDMSTFQNVTVTAGDTAPPIAVISAVSPDPRSTPVSSMTLAFTEPVSGFDLADLSLTRDAIPLSLSGASLTSSDNLTWTLGNLAGLTATAGTYTLTLTAAGSGITDAIGNVMTSNASRSWLADISPPIAAIPPVSPDPRNTSVSSMTITFTEVITGFDLADLRFTRNGNLISLSGATLATSDNLTWTLSRLQALTASAGTYLMTLIASGSGITDALGNAIAADASDTWVTDVTVPTATVAPVTPDPRSTPVSSMTITFSEAISGLDLADLSLTRSGSPVALSGATLVSSDNITWTLDNLAGLTGTAGNYALALTASGSGITDLAGNALSVNASDTWVTQTAAAPTAVITAVAPDPRNTAVSSITITFSGAITGFDLADLAMSRTGGPVSLSGATLTSSDNITWTLGNLAGLTGTAGSYTLTLTAAGSGIVDGSGNPLAANAADSWVTDTTAPIATISEVAPDPRRTSVSSMTLTFSEPISGFDLADLSLTRSGSPVSLSGATLSSADNITWTLDNLAGLTASDGNYLLVLTASSSGVGDPAGNALAGDASESWAMDTTAPITTITAVSPDPRDSSVSSMTLIFSEAVNGFDLADLALSRDGYPVGLSGASLSSADNITWTVSGLAGLTRHAGSYLLTLTAAGSGISDTTGNALTANASEGWLMDAVNGTEGPDTITLARGTTVASVTVNGDSYSLNLGSFSRLFINGQGGDDSITLDLSVASGALPSDGFVIDAGDGADSLTATGGAGDDSVALSESQLTFNGVLVSGSNAEDLFFALGGGNNGLTLDGTSYAFADDASLTSSNLSLTLTNAATVTFAASQHLSTLDIDNTSQATLPSSGKTLNLTGLNLHSTGTLDLNDNTVIWDYSGQSNPTASLRALLASSFNTNWNGDGLGHGLISTTAQGDGLKAIGYVDNSLFPDGVHPDSSVILRTSYWGDGNLDGVVDPTDFDYFVYGYFPENGAPTCWMFGDLTYDGIIDPTDFDYFVYGYFNQGAPLSAAVQASSVGGSAFDSGAADDNSLLSDSYSLLDSGRL